MLFAVPVRMGKAMAAEHLVHELGLARYRIGLGVVVSKCVGETEKHLDRVLGRAARLTRCFGSTRCSVPPPGVIVMPCTALHRCQQAWHCRRGAPAPVRRARSERPVQNLNKSDEPEGQASRIREDVRLTALLIDADNTNDRGHTVATVLWVRGVVDLAHLLHGAVAVKVEQDRGHAFVCKRERTVQFDLA